MWCARFPGALCFQAMARFVRGLDGLGRVSSLVDQPHEYFVLGDDERIHGRHARGAGAYLIDSRWLSVGGLIACNLLAGRAMGSVASLFSVIGKWQDFSRAAERMERSLEQIPEGRCLSRPTTAGKIDVIGLGKTYEHRPPAC